MKPLSLSRSGLSGGILLSILLLSPSFAFAHIGVHSTDGAIYGLLHPLIGMDHLVAILAVGLMAAQRSGREIVFLPLTFMIAMASGGILGIANISIPFVEGGIVASLLLLGMLIAAATRLPFAAIAMLVGLFALFHGHAHGTEMPEGASALRYGIGFLFTTGLLHLLGIGLGLLAQRVARRPLLIRYAGGAVTVFGISLILV